MDGLIKVAPDGWQFVDSATGERFTPIGCNYYDPETGWPPHLWQMFDANRVERHFAKMTELGVKVVRIFLTVASFQPEPYELAEEGFRKLDHVRVIAARHGMRLILSGPDHWEGLPGWYDDQFAHDLTMSSQAFFWSEVARRYAGDPTVMAYGFLNEPMVRWSSPSMEQRWPVWLKRKYLDLKSLAAAWGTSGGWQDWGNVPVPPNVADPGSPRLFDYQLFREDIAARWLARLVEAVKTFDPDHLTTVELIQWSVPLHHFWIHEPGGYAGFNPQCLAPLVDYVSIHYYPIIPFGDGYPALRDYQDQALARLKTVARLCYAGKPVVLEEFGWEGGGSPERPHFHSEEDQVAWCDSVIRSTLGSIAGWLNWPFQDTVSATDCSKYSGFLDANGREKPWGTVFRNWSHTLNGKNLAHAPANEVAPVDWRWAVTAFDTSVDTPGYPEGQVMDEYLGQEIDFQIIY